MSTISHQPTATLRRPSWLEARNLWASISIVVIWASVLLTALFGPDFESVSASGDRTTIPVGGFVAFFALFATVAVAKYGFEKKARVD